MYTRSEFSQAFAKMCFDKDFELTMKAKQNPSTSSLEENLDT